MASTNKSLEAPVGKNSVVLQKNEQLEKKMVDRMVQNRLASEKKLADERLKIIQDTETKIHQLELAGDTKKNKQSIQKFQDQLETLLKEQDKFEQSVLALKDEALKQMETAELSRFKRMTLSQKAIYRQQLKDQLLEQRKTLAEELKDKQEALKKAEAENDQNKQAKIQSEIQKIQAQQQTTDEHLTKVQKQSGGIGGALGNFLIASKEHAASSKQEAQAQYAQAKDKKKSMEEEYKNDKKYQDAQSKYKQATSAAEKKKFLSEMKNIEDAHKKKLETDAEYQEAVQTSSEATKDLVKADFESMAASAKALGGKLMSSAASSIDDNIEAMFGSQGRMMGRLQGSAIDWAKTVDSVSDTIGFSGIVSKKSVVNKMVELVDSGVAYNLEMRAFLAETSQNIASTFNATNGTLLRLIRLQQSDSTAARLGMEASLTSLFNKYFEDSSYLAEDVSESVSSAILDATATMTREQSVEFEYMVQKWLGALYSIGTSSETVSKIATGLNYLGTGNVSALAGDEGTATLLQMAAARTGKSYSQYLTNGLTAEDTNNLLKAIIELLGGISDNQTNYVTKSAYADLFGMSITDLSSFASLTNEEIKTLHDNTKNYTSFVKETTTQLSQIGNRINLSTLVDTAIDNALVGAATTIGSNAFTYGTWKSLGILKDTVGEIKIPSVLAAGFGLSSDIDLLNVAQTGMVGLGLLGSLVGAIGSMNKGGVTKLANWNFKDSTSRGSGLKILKLDATEGLSSSGSIGVGSASGGDVEAVSLQAAQTQAYNNSTTSAEEVEEGQKIPQKILDAIAGESTPTVLSLLQDIDSKLAEDRVFYTAITGAISSPSTRIATLTAQVASAQMNTQTILESDAAINEQGSTTKSSTNSVTGSAGQQSDIAVESMEEIIAKAIRTALTDSSISVPVTLTPSFYGGNII